MNAILAAMLCLMIAGVPVRDAQKSKGAHHMKGRCPLKIVLSRKSDGRLEALLENISDRPQVYLHHLDVQPSELVLKTARGKTIKPFDSRSIRKVDLTVYRTMYETLQPGEKAVLHAESFSSQENGLFGLYWSPYRYRDLKPGRYSAYVRWRSGENSWEDSETHATGLIDSIWTGSLTSNRVAITLPPGGEREEPPKH